jgi:lipoprotein-anchoring transpeptidase ErfK/SrfK
MISLNRRQMLKLILAGATTAALSPILHARARYPAADPMPPRPGDGSSAWTWMGRAIYTVTFYEEADRTSERLDARRRDEGFRLLDEVRAPYSAHNDLWYETSLGYVHSAWVLPVRVYAPQPFIADVGEWGFWGQISQLHTAARTAPNVNAAQKYRLYGGTVYHIVEAAQDDAGTGWYKVVDDYPPGTISYQWVLARDVRRLSREEITPIHPFVGDKRIEVDLSAQRLDCYEGDRLVFTTPVASGMAGETATVQGEKCVLLKQASRHMANTPYEGMDEEDLPDPDDIFDLPGVPWNIFFDLDGTAIHGTYWHNDFGVRRSHGCLNVPIEAARWIYRWVHPIGGYEDAFIQSDCRVGTPIHVS